ncbi:DUF1934 domain-containing protein [Paenibacillus sp. 1P07SE]|uniref:DUF1934 domain-containing protein n=1 Tax=Paenibacillus sp. 1P07SE TaxID=3132209 RepID=UPI0039A4DCA1
MQSAKTKVKMTLESRHDDELSVHTYSGDWAVRNRSAFLIYEELEEGRRLRTTVRWDDGLRELKITRRGDVETEHHYVQGARRRGEYRITGARLEMETETDYLALAPDSESAHELPVTIEWKYRLWMSGEPVGYFQLKMHIQEVIES